MDAQTYMQARNYSPRTQALYAQALAGIDPLDGAEVARILAARANRSGSWARITYSAVLAAENAAQVPASESIRSRIPRPIARPSVPLIHDRAPLRAALSQAPTSQRLAFTLLYAAALRPAELCALQLADVGPEYVVIRNAKTRDGARVYITPHLAARVQGLAEDRDPNAPIWSVTPRDLRRAWYELEQRAHLPHLPLYSLRHAAAVHMLQAGYDLEQVRRHLRHASLDTTQVYLQCLPDALRKEPTP